MAGCRRRPTSERGFGWLSSGWSQPSTAFRADTSTISRVLDDRRRSVRARVAKRNLRKDQKEWPVGRRLCSWSLGLGGKCMRRGEKFAFFAEKSLRICLLFACLVIFCGGVPFWSYAS